MDLSRIAHRPSEKTEPYWDQSWWTGVDAAALYMFVRERQPRRYHEVGSGNSTLFAARAVRDGGLATEILSVDPEPRADVDAVCTTTLRLPLQQADVEEIAALESVTCCSSTRPTMPL